MNLVHRTYSFLVDVNLPKQFSFFNKRNFTHIVDINSKMTDEEIWDYAMSEDKVIITKDTDFYERSISSLKKPKVIFLQLGNITLKELHHFFDLHWPTIIKQLENADLVIVNKEKIKILN